MTPPDPALSAVLSFGARGAIVIMVQLVFAVKDQMARLTRISQDQENLADKSEVACLKLLGVALR